MCFITSHAGDDTYIRFNFVPTTAVPCARLINGVFLFDDNTFLIVIYGVVQTFQNVITVKNLNLLAEHEMTGLLFNY